ncbi:MAG: hypothetical protein AB7I37_26275 [Pirellulales bacterium]
MVAPDKSVVAKVYAQGGLASDNAALIAAAPELVKWLKQVLIDFRTLDKGGMCDHLRSVEQAEWLLADLEGNDWEPDQCCECDEPSVGYSEGSPYCAAHYKSRPA